jgi:hypothetical protein
VAVPEDDVSRFLFGLYRDAGAIRVRRAGTVTFGQAQEAHMRRVVEAWMAATRAEPDSPIRLGEVRSLPIRPTRLRARLRAALERRLARG